MSIGLLIEYASQRRETRCICMQSIDTRYLDDDGSSEWTAIAEELRALGVNSKKHAIVMHKPKL